MLLQKVFDDQIPPKVAIAEAIRLSRKFNTPESASFVNALLDHLYQTSQGGQVDSQQLTQKFQALTQSEKIAFEAAQEHSLNKNESDHPPERNSPHDIDETV